MRVVFAIAAVAALAACEQVDKVAETPTGRPEVSFSTKDVQSVTNKIPGICSQVGLMVQSVSSNEVICGGTMSGGQAVMTQLAIGNSYSTTPEQHVRFTTFPVGNETRVQAYRWAETVMPFGQVRKLEITSHESFNEIMKAMMSVGGKPVGVTPSA